MSKLGELASGNRCLVKNANRIPLHFVRGAVQNGEMTPKKDRHPLGVTRRVRKRAKFVEEFSRKRGTSFRRICEPDSASLRSRSRAEWGR